MLKAAYLLLLSALRNKSYLFWMVIFPVLLMALFGALYSGGGGEQKPPVFLYANGTMEKVLENALNSTFDLKIVERVEDPTVFVLNATAALRLPATLIVANQSTISIYSASNIWGPIVAEAVDGALYYAFYPQAQIPVNVTLKIIGGEANATSLLAQGPTSVAVALTLVEALGAGITGVLGMLGALVVTGLNKRAALSRISKIRIALAAAIAAFLASLVGVNAILIVAGVLYRVEPADILAKWQWWASYVLNYLLFAGIALLMTRALVMGKAEAQTMMGTGVMLFLLFAFATGYFIPLEVMPKAMADFALSMPTSYTLAFARVAVLGGPADPAELFYPAVAAIAVFSLGLYFFKPYSKP